MNQKSRLGMGRRDPEVRRRTCSAGIDDFRLSDYGTHHPDSVLVSRLAEISLPHSIAGQEIFGGVVKHHLSRLQHVAT